MPGWAARRSWPATTASSVTLIDRNNYHQFQPLLYQVATSQLAPSDIAALAARGVQSTTTMSTSSWPTIAEVDPTTRTVTSADGQRWSGDVLVLAAGSQPNFFDTPGAADHAFPLYSLDHATNLRSRILGLFEQVDRNPRLIQRGALNFVIVGGGPTGVEVAGAIADMVNVTVPAVYHDLDASAAQIHLLDYGDALLKPFSDSAHAYVAKVLEEKGVQIHLGTGVKEVASGHAVLSDGTHDRHSVRGVGRRHQGGGGRGRCVAWLRAGEVAWTWSTTSRSPARRRLCHRRHRQHPGRGRPRAASARVRRAAERRLGGQEHPVRSRGQAARAVRLPRQGDHGDDRSWRGDRRGRQAPPRDPRRDGPHGMARGARQPDDRHQGQDRGVRRLGLGRVLQDRRPTRARPRRCRGDRLGRRRRGGAGPARPRPLPEGPTFGSPGWGDATARRSPGPLVGWSARE